jgi:release factor glutamine methyltransferase
VPTIRELIKESEEKLDANNKDCNVPKVLYYHVSNLQPHELYLKMDEEVPEDIYKTYSEYLERYLNGEPVQYIKGKEYFFSREFSVDENVLIPRYETEELVEQLLYRIDDYFKDQEKIDLCDVGTGSGAIGISLDLEVPKAKVVATDISEEALKVAKKNNDDLGANVTFYAGDMLEPLIDHHVKVDVFVSNPPYIPQDQNIDPMVKDNEPHVALFGGEDGLYFYRKIFKDVKKVIKDRALLGFEMGFDQREIMEKAVHEYFGDTPFEIIKDMNGKDRMLFIYHNLKDEH